MKGLTHYTLEYGVNGHAISGRSVEYRAVPKGSGSVQVVVLMNGEAYFRTDLVDYVSKKLVTQKGHTTEELGMPALAPGVYSFYTAAEAIEVLTSDGRTRSLTVEFIKVMDRAATVTGAWHKGSPDAEPMRFIHKPTRLGSAGQYGRCLVEECGEDCARVLIEMDQKRASDKSLKLPPLEAMDRLLERACRGEHVNMMIGQLVNQQVQHYCRNPAHHGELDA